MWVSKNIGMDLDNVMPVGLGNTRISWSETTLNYWMMLERYPNLRGRSHQTFRSVLAVKVLGIMLRNRCWPTTFLTITAGDADGWCRNWPVWSTPQGRGWWFDSGCDISSLLDKLLPGGQVHPVLWCWHGNLTSRKKQKKTKPYYDLDRLCPEISPGCKKQFHSISLVNFLLSNNLDIQNGNAACVESSRSRLAVWKPACPQCFSCGIWAWLPVTKITSVDIEGWDKLLFWEFSEPRPHEPPLSMLLPCCQMGP